MSRPKPHSGAVSSSSEFFQLVSGKDDIFGGSAKYEAVKTFLEAGASGDKAGIFGAAILFYEKPLRFIATGSTKAGSDQLKAYDRKILKWVPKLSLQQQEEAKVLSPKFAARLSSLGEFGNVNRTSVRLLALLFYNDTVMNNKDVTNIKMFNQFVLKYGRKPIPEVIAALRSQGDETSAIKADGMEQFWNEKFIWETMKFI
jgi:hypothetical protein